MHFLFANIHFIKRLSALFHILSNDFLYDCSIFMNDFGLQAPDSWDDCFAQNRSALLITLS
ncbi:MAG: hypothetical protein EA358_00065 [Flavobacteriales bacterium]|nr:MAG: hypothetical protein EA358_00065 [Flavobacteriales bacterium]